MAELKDLDKIKLSITVTPKETILQSAAKDLITFSLLAFCIYFSKEGVFWLFVTCLLMIFFAASKLKQFAKLRINVFDNYDDASRFLMSEKFKNSGQSEGY